MSSDDLPGALAAAEARMAARLDLPSTPAPEAEAVAILRSVARLLGHNPDSVADSFLKGGPLADLVRAVIGAEMPRRRRGRPPKRVETWHTFISIVRLRRAGFTLEQAIAQIATATKKPEATIRAQYDRTRAAGVSPEHVPDSPIAAEYADPRPKV